MSFRIGTQVTSEQIYNINCLCSKVPSEFRVNNNENVLANSNIVWLQLKHMYCMTAVFREVQTVHELLKGDKHVCIVTSGTNRARRCVRA